MSSPRETKSELRTAMGHFWSKVFLDQDYVDASTGSVGIRAQVTRDLEDSLQYYISRYTIPVFRLHDTRLFTFSTRDMDSAVNHYGDAGLEYGDPTLLYGLTTDDPDSPRFPIGDFVPPYLSTSILEPGHVLTLGTDYTVEDGYIQFRESPLRDENILKTVVVDSESSYRTFMYWGFRSEEDQKDLCSFFGTIAGICGFSSEDLKAAINIAWDLRVSGASESLVNRLFSLLAHVDYVHTGGIVQEIYTEGDRRCVRTKTDIYTGPVNSDVTVAQGQTISKNDTLFESFQIRPGSDILDSDFLSGLTLGKGYIQLTSGGGMFFKNSYVPIYTYFPEGWYRLERDGTNFIVYNSDDNIIDTVPESEATALIDAAPPLSYGFEVGGHPEDVTDFLAKLNLPDSSGITFFDRLASKWGKIPDTIRPFEEMRDFYLQANSLFVKMTSQLFPSNVTAQLLNVLKAIIPAGTTFFLNQEVTEEDDESIRTENLAPVGYC